MSRNLIEELILKNRSYRRFYQEAAVSEKTLHELVDLSRLCPSAANLQPLRCIISSKPEKNELIFPYLSWAGYLKDWQGPREGERPSAYIVILCDTEISNNALYDCGIAAQSIMLGAVERGLGGCMIASINKEKLQQALDIEERYDILLALALGKPKEKVVIEEVAAKGDIKYWRDEKNVHHVPKRKLKDIILK